MKKGNKQYRIVDVIILLFFVSMVKSFSFLLAIAFVSLLYSFISLKKCALMKLLRPVAPFALLMLLPMVLSYLFTRSLGDWNFHLMILLKVLISAVILGTVVEKRGAYYLIEELLDLGFPSFFNRILALCYRYFYMIHEDVSMGRRALILRGIQERKGFSSISVFGQWIGGFFVKSSLHGDRIFQAMKCRGFEGESKERALLKPKLLLRSFTLIVLLSITIYLEGRLYGN